MGSAGSPYTQPMTTVSAQAMKSSVIPLAPYVSIRWKRTTPPSIERERERESLTFGEGELKRFPSITSIFPPDLADERQPQEEADHGDGQNQQLSGTRPAQLPREQVSNGRGQALHAHKLEGDGTD